MRGEVSKAVLAAQAKATARRHRLGEFHFKTGGFSIESERVQTRLDGKRVGGEY